MSNVKHLRALVGVGAAMLLFITIAAIGSEITGQAAHWNYEVGRSGAIVAIDAENGIIREVAAIRVLNSACQSVESAVVWKAGERGRIEYGENIFGVTICHVHPNQSWPVQPHRTQPETIPLIRPKPQVEPPIRAAFRFDAKSVIWYKSARNWRPRRAPMQRYILLFLLVMMAASCGGHKKVPPLTFEVRKMPTDLSIEQHRKYDRLAKRLVEVLTSAQNRIQTNGTWRLEISFTETESASKNHWPDWMPIMLSGPQGMGMLYHPVTLGAEGDREIDERADAVAGEVIGIMVLERTVKYH